MPPWAGDDKWTLHAAPVKSSGIVSPPRCPGRPGRLSCSAGQPGPHCRGSAPAPLPIGGRSSCARRCNPSAEAFDVILIDCPPALKCSYNALVAADSGSFPMPVPSIRARGPVALLATVNRSAGRKSAASIGRAGAPCSEPEQPRHEVSAQLVTHSATRCSHHHPGNIASPRRPLRQAACFMTGNPAALSRICARGGDDPAQRRLRRRGGAAVTGDTTFRRPRARGCERSLNRPRGRRGHLNMIHRRPTLAAVCGPARARATDRPTPAPPGREQLAKLPVDLLQRRYQPAHRHVCQTLADSPPPSRPGRVQPIVVRRWVPGVAASRSATRSLRRTALRAAQMAGSRRFPAVIPTFR